jgi:hypothetical protein
LILSDLKRANSVQKFEPIKTNSHGGSRPLTRLKATITLVVLCVVLCGALLAQDKQFAVPQDKQLAVAPDKQLANPPRVQETHSRVPVSGDPVVSVSPSKTPPALPAGARNGPGIKEEEPVGGWEKARWTHPTLHVTGTAQTAVPVTAPSTLLIGATWKSNSVITVNVLKGNTVLAALTSRKTFDGKTSATANVKVPAAGSVVIQAKSSTATPVDVVLYIGVVAGTH